MNTLTLALVGDETRRRWLKEWLHGQHHVEVLGEVGDASGLRLIAGLEPDVVLLDCAAAQINPLVTLAQLQALQPAPQVVALAATNSPSEQRLMLELGAVAYASDRKSLLRALGLAARLTFLTHRRRSALAFAA